MGKYDPLTDYLKSLHGRAVRVTFAEIERIIGRPLPGKSKTIRAWWSNNPDNNVMTRAWLAAAYRTAQVDIAREVLTFEPETAGGLAEMEQTEFKNEPGSQPSETSGQPDKPAHHPAYGALKGMFTIPPGVDLTEPAFEDWKTLYGENQ